MQTVSGHDALSKPVFNPLDPRLSITLSRVLCYNEPMRRRRSRPQTEQPSRAALNMRRYRARLRKGILIYPVPLGWEELEAMARWNWMPREQQDNKIKVGEVVAFWLANAAGHR